MASKRHVFFTKHALESVTLRFPEAAEFKQRFPTLFIRALTACAGNARESAEKHYVMSKGFLLGKLKIPWIDKPIPIYFAYSFEDGKYVICTVLTEELLAGDGARQHG